MRLLLACFLIPSLALAAPGGDYARKQALRKSAEAWVKAKVVPNLNMRNVRNIGVEVDEGAPVLPPDFGRHPLAKVLVKVGFNATGYDGRFDQTVFCRFDQYLWAETNPQNYPVKIQKGQEYNRVISCLSGAVPGDWR